MGRPGFSPGKEWAGPVFPLGKLPGGKGNSGLLNRVSIPGVGMWHNSGCLSKIVGFLRKVRFLPPCKTTECQHLHHREPVYKFYELSM